MSVSEYVSELMARPEPVMTEQGRAALARAVLAIKLAYGEPIRAARIPALA